MIGTNVYVIGGEIPGVKAAKNPYAIDAMKNYGRVAVLSLVRRTWSHPECTGAVLVNEAQEHLHKWQREKPLRLFPLEGFVLICSTNNNIFNNSFELVQDMLVFVSINKYMLSATNRRTATNSVCGCWTRAQWRGISSSLTVRSRAVRSRARTAVATLRPRASATPSTSSADAPNTAHIASKWCGWISHRALSPTCCTRTTCWLRACRPFTATQLSASVTLFLCLAGLSTGKCRIACLCLTRKRTK